LRRGQEHEALGTAAALADAVRCYDEAIALLRALSLEDNARARRDLGIAWMNRGNALQKHGTTGNLAEAVQAYDEAIGLLRTLANQEDHSLRNSLGAAWMNRGLALHRQADSAALAGAVQSHRAAVAFLQTLPLDETPAYRRNLVAAWMNQANALLDSTLPDHLVQARSAARESLALVTAEETADLVMADLGLKARRAQCDAIGQLLVANTTGLSTDALAAEAGDAVDAGLALIRHWERQGLTCFRPLAVRFFHFGTQLYRLHQPHFLAEFVLENLDPAHSPGAMPGIEALHPIATNAMATALDGLRERRLILTDDAESSRLLRTWQDLQAVRTRLTVLRESQGFNPSTSRA
jgi:tetratricopeptide (TPR) repeat protein